MRQGFSLIELAILLLIAGGLAAASTMLGSAYLDGAEVRATRDNIKTLERAISAYAQANKRLPCPADEAVSPSHADYGKEASGLGTCTAATTTSGEVKRGVLPFQTLGISQSLAYDAWGNRLSYFVDRRMTVDNALEVWPEQNTTIGDIIVQDLGGGIRASKAVYALLSTGAKAHGSINRSGTMQRLSDPSTDELENVDVDAAGANPAPDKVLVQGMVGTGSDAKDFDDIVSYKLRSNLVTSPVNAIQNCIGATVNWNEGANSCTGSIAEVPDGTVIVVSDISGPATGSVTVHCSAGVLTQSSPDCEAPGADCPATAVNWTVDAACAGNVAGTTPHGATTASIANTTGGRTGTATFTCSSGSLNVNPGAVCGDNCAAGTANWTGTASCTSAHGALNHGASVTISDSTAPGLGNVTMTCTNGAPPSQSAATCTPAGCGATTLSWGAGCSRAVTAQSSGYSAGVTNSASGFTGTGTAACTDGAWSVASPVCNANCTAQAVSWTVSGQTCNQSVGALAHGAAATISDAVPATTGGVTVTCANGTLNQSGATCVGSVGCSAQAVSWTQFQTCNDSVGALAHGASQTATDSSMPGTGTATYTCNNGTITPSSAVCGANCAVPTSWVGQGGTYGTSSCTQSSWGFAIHGAGGSAMSTNALFGYITGNCNNGTWSTSLRVCLASCPGGTYNWGAGCTQTYATFQGNNTGTVLTDGTAPNQGAASIRCTDGVMNLIWSNCNP